MGHVTTKNFFISIQFFLMMMMMMKKDPNELFDKGGKK